VGPLLLVDAHTHLFSRVFFETLARQAGHDRVQERLARLETEAGVEVPDADVSRLVARWTDALDRAGVRHAITFASVPEEAPVVAEAVRLSRGRLTGYAAVDPRAPGAAAAVQTLFEERGFRGVLLFPALHHVHPSGPETREVLGVVARHRGVAVVHCGTLRVRMRELLGLPCSYDLSYANPLGVVPAANAFPDVAFVIPHFGAGLLGECLRAGLDCENVHVDTSSSNAWRAAQTPQPTLAEVLDRAMGAFGTKRILFGTDSSAFPRGWRYDVWQELVEALDAIGAPAEDRADVLGLNALRLLRTQPG
jgi:predicted TIM-barrel fold metal-dependent hydrolase